MPRSTLRIALTVPATAILVLTTLGLAPVAAHAATATAQQVYSSLLVTAGYNGAYNRDDFAHWIDADGDGCDTRQEVLIEESQSALSGCPVTSGSWFSWYDGATWSSPADVDIDHFVPLAESWRSGAYAWTAQQRQEFANDLAYPLSLVAVTDNVNQSKGDKDPASWLPPDSSRSCEYAIDWVLVKYRWKLTIDNAESNALAGIFTGACGATTVTLPTVASVPDPIESANPATTQKTVYRFWSPKNQTHFYTMNVAERDNIISSYPLSTWTYEGPRYQAFDVQQPGTVPLYRFWSPRLSGHFFTTNEGEKDSVIRDYDDYTWTFEGVAFYVYPGDVDVPSTLPVARFWSPQNQHHFYTASAEETQVVRTSYPARIWTFEGFNFRVPIDVGLEIPATPPQYYPPAAPPPPPPPAPPGNPGNSKNCGDFSNWAQAWNWYSTYFPHYGDVAQLDADNDGIPCESLPGAP